MRCSLGRDNRGMVHENLPTRAKRHRAIAQLRGSSISSFYIIPKHVVGSFFGLPLGSRCASSGKYFLTVSRDTSHSSAICPCGFFSRASSAILLRISAGVYLPRSAIATSPFVCSPLRIARSVVTAARQLLFRCPRLYPCSSTSPHFTSSLSAAANARFAAASTAASASNETGVPSTRP